jgi:cell surface protein SprA
LVIAQRLAAARNPNYTTNSTSFPDGYSKNHEEVLLYSFLSAYQGKNASSIKIPDLNTPNSTKGFFPSIPIPNWRLNYNGLNSLAFIKKHFKSFTLSHAYSSTLNMNGVKNDIMFDGSDVTNAEGDYITNIDYTALDVSIKESFNPLVKVDMKFKNSILAKVEVKKSRTVGMNFGGSITENSTWDVVVGAGYTIKDLVVPRVKIRGKKLKSNLDLRADVSIKNTNLTMIQIDKTITPTSGGLVTAIKVSGDYVVSKKVTARLFYDQTINTPFIQTSYPSSTSKGGISIRFTL